jgi:hypothetical protein
MNFKIHLYIAIILVLIQSCATEKKTNSEPMLDDKSIMLFDCEYCDYFYSENESWKPTLADIDILDKVILNSIEKEEFLNASIKITQDYKNEYYRQYLPYLDNNGNRIIRINAFCTVLDAPTIMENGKVEMAPIDWRNEYMSIEDGGSCYWKMKINIDSAFCISLYSN